MAPAARERAAKAPGRRHTKQAPAMSVRPPSDASVAPTMVPVDTVAGAAGVGAADGVGVCVRVGVCDGVRLRDGVGVTDEDADAEHVADDDGEPVADDDGEVVCDDDGVAVWDDDGVPVCDGDAVAVGALAQTTIPESVAATSDPGTGPTERYAGPFSTGSAGSVIV